MIALHVNAVQRFAYVLACQLLKVSNISCLLDMVANLAVCAGSVSPLCMSEREKERDQLHLFQKLGC